MRTLPKLARRCVKETEAQDLIEYAFLAATIGFSLIVSLQLLGTSIVAVYDGVAQVLSAAPRPGSAGGSTGAGSGTGNGTQGNGHGRGGGNSGNGQGNGGGDGSGGQNNGRGGSRGN